MAPACRELGVGQIVWSPLAQGVLAGKYLPGSPVPADSRAADRKSGGATTIKGFLRDEVLERVGRLRPLADEAGLSTAQLALAWVLRNPDVAAAIIGASRPEQITENAAAAGVTLEPELVARMDAILAPVAECDPALTEKSSPKART